jgi:hypothetical protein
MDEAKASSVFRSVLLWNQPHRFSMEAVSIALMRDPVRFHKKACKRMRGFAKRISVTADKLGTESMRSRIALALRRLAERNLSLAQTP